MWSSIVVLVVSGVLYHLQSVVTGLRITIEVPPHPVVGQTQRLACNFDMENEELYSVKWYKGTTEFYRYVPRDVPQIQVYRATGVDVNVSASSHNVITLSNISLSSSGVYRCEVSAEAPSFVTVSDESDMTVIAIPEGPVISGGRQKYEEGDRVNVNCTSSKSRPAAMLFWTINGESAPRDSLEEYAVGEDSEGLQTSVLGLRFLVQAKHFVQHGEVRIKCTATIAPIYHQSNEEALVVSKLQASVLESKETPVQQVKQDSKPITSSTTTTTKNSASSSSINWCQTVVQESIFTFLIMLFR